MRTRWSTLVVLVLVFTLVGVVAPTPVASQVGQNLACPPELVPDAGFTDVDPASAHKADIDCLAWYEITTGTSANTFEPKGLVSRWQMALFLIRTYTTLQGEDVDGSDRGFSDISELSAETQVAINKLSQLSITSGTTPTTFDPYGAVTRWQMALFLTRLMRADGVTLPDGSDQGFADIGHLPATTQTAINQLRQLEITAGTSPTTFDPDGSVTREQMASFLARSLMADGTIHFLAWGTADCDELGNCTFSGTFPANTRFAARWGWYWTPLPVPPGEQHFFTSATRIELTVDGQPVALVEKLVSLDDIVVKWHEAIYPGMTGNHTFQVRWFWNNQLENTWSYSLLFTE